MLIKIDQNLLDFSKNPELLSTDNHTIIFLHDSLGCNALWRDFPKKLGMKTKCDVLSYDRQGYGGSAPFLTKHRDHDYLKNEAELLGKIIDKFNLQNVILFGHSDGGSIALLTAALFPEKIAGIITEGAHIFVEQETINGIKDAVLAYKHTNLKSKLEKYHKEKTDDVFNMWTKTWLSESYQSWNIEQYLHHIQCPSLIIQGVNDEYGTQKQVENIVNKTSGHSIPLLIPEIGHTPHKENPTIVIKETTKFLKNNVLIFQ